MISLHHNHHITVSHRCQSCLVFWKGEKHGSGVCFRCNLFWSSVQQRVTKKKTAAWYITAQLGISEFNRNCSGAVVLDGVLYCREQVHRGCVINSLSMQDSLVITQYGKIFCIAQRWVCSAYQYWFQSVLSLFYKAVKHNPESTTAPR